ncbi:ribosomal-protein-alanine N-acetyltransferase [candidate division WOR-1 bacterium RIFCSPLOWO2_02_FULL_46_20]|uniref:[Ribosomal protein bS18]-alanine N-acetyltransferase n=2 Tax=Saganbacteria TaxID=1703751 RepID=A0A1F4R8V0_UNCSA|nr:MAG: ribosomal-protein-alanine N-acetyltransferase [candidate division WOR-1 bacterium RIFCSPHIGHO2_02_FULL_45_12]OGC04599.1 MAG: ribosomal-protein-alanine N-acetyltransferase [candidate division WOR-1 bacterium RIFCSPLOWO2_02_FULL_46_20]OGC08848.1 MAG: ribosomal-protein-alanine N-acetyltransferase [candidate division WOR-1 bacterium RIFCSPLOWO2_12_FULL_45_9]
MLNIAPLKEEDIAAVVAIESLSFSAPKEEAIFKSDQNKYLVAREDGEIIGYIGVEKISGEIHVINMAVAPEHRNQGIGNKLMEKILNNIDVFFLEVRASNLAAQGLYEKFGFKKVGVRRRYYSNNGEDACLMRREPK